MSDNIPITDYESIYKVHGNLIYETKVVYEWFDLHRKIIQGVPNHNKWVWMLASEYKHNHNELDLLVEARALARKICFLNKQLMETGFDPLLLRKYNVISIPAPGSEKWAIFTKDIYEVIDIFEAFFAGYKEYLRTMDYDPKENGDCKALDYWNYIAK